MPLLIAAPLFFAFELPTITAWQNKFDDYQILSETNAVCWNSCFTIQI